MKHNKVLLAGSFLATAMTLGSCVGDLDLSPTDPSVLTPNQFSENAKENLQNAMAGVYLQFATYGANGDASVQGFDGGMSTFQRALFILEEVPTDEASWIPNDADYGLFQYGIIPAGNTVVMGTYSRLFINIAMCNQFIQTVNSGVFGDMDAETKALADEFVRQARILRAATYYYAIDCFGNVPYADENVAMTEIAPQLSTDFATGRRMVYDNVVKDLEDVVAWYKANDPNNKPAYGYVGLDVAESILVKFYLNAEVYTGTPNWQACYDHADAIIKRLGKGGFNGTGLTKGYHQNFGCDNKKYVSYAGNGTDGQEIIWTIPQQQTVGNDGKGLLSYANSTFMCNAWIGTSPAGASYTIDQKGDYNSGNGWKCIVAREEFVELFDWNGAYSASPDARVKFWKTAASGFKRENISLNQADWGNNGFLAVKYTNWSINDNNDIDQDASPEPTNQLGGDYAMIRLAEIYLSAAEAIMHGAGNEATALQYVNNIRARAGLEAYSTLSLGALEQERARELYSESTRRTDLIRYGKWISGYTWAWKNQTRRGSDFASNFNVYPLPSVTVSRNGYTQNPNY